MGHRRHCEMRIANCRSEAEIPTYRDEYPIERNTDHASRITQYVATFSIAAVDVDSGDLGVAVQSKFPNVRPVVPWVEAGVGAIATQASCNVSYGAKGLALMRNGATAEEALRLLITADEIGRASCRERV